MSRDDRLKVGLVFGGRSGEHAISILSARSVFEALDVARFDVSPIAISRSGRWFLHSRESFLALGDDAEIGAAFDVLPTPSAGCLDFLDRARPEHAVATVDFVFPVLHGPYGEDGTFQGLLEIFDVPYVGSGVLGSSVGMDKDVQKRLLRDAGIAVVPFVAVRQTEWECEPASVIEKIRSLGPTVFVKPANLGSSVGIHKVVAPGNLAPAILDAFKYDTKIVIERGLNAREIECAVLGNDRPRVAVPGEIVPGDDFYSYEDKYGAASKSKLLIPAPIAPEIASEIQQTAVAAFLATECSGLARVDFFFERETGEVYVNELNTMPGFTAISMYPKLWEATGLSYPDLAVELIQLGRERAISRRQVRTGYTSTHPGR